MPSKNLTPEGQRTKLFKQRMPCVEKKMNELVAKCRAEVALFILPHDDDEMWVFKTRLDFPNVNRVRTLPGLAYLIITSVGDHHRPAHPGRLGG